MVSPKSLVEPVIKWSGSKRYVAPELSKYVIKGGKYIEPFLGGGSMLPFRKSSRAIASDIIPELIDLWNNIKTNPNEVATEYSKRWERLQNEGHSVYYEVRDSFNTTKNPHDFLFITRTCVNGLIRYNSNGEFNNSMHKSRPGINPKSFLDILLKWSIYIKDVEFRHCDYRTSLLEAEPGDFVFLDPPYGGTKGRYTKSEFVLESFYEQLEILNKRGVNWMLTFDGSAGDREYQYAPHKELYLHKFNIKTGNSPFTKTMRTTIDAVHESVYLNFKPTTKIIDSINNNINQELVLF